MQVGCPYQWQKPGSGSAAGMATAVATRAMSGSAVFILIVVLVGLAVQGLQRVVVVGNLFLVTCVEVYSVES